MTNKSKRGKNGTCRTGQFTAQKLTKNLRIHNDTYKMWKKAKSESYIQAPWICTEENINAEVSEGNSVVEELQLYSK